MADDTNKPDQASPEKTPIKLSGTGKKSDTTRIDLASAKPPPSITDAKDLPPDAAERFAQSTMRIDLPPDLSGKTDKSKTSRIELTEAETRIGAPKPPEPATIAPLKARPVKPTAVEGESIVVAPSTTASAAEQAKKSETARIDLPADLSGDRPATRPKTIRIKRSDGTTSRKSLAITRTVEDQPTAAPTVSAYQGVEIDDVVGTVESVLALVATVVALVLTYMLAAQTVATNLPFPGKI